MPSIKLNALSQWFSYGVNALTMLALTPFIVHKLDVAGFGVWRFALTFVGYYGFLNIAVSSSVTRYVARYAGNGDEKSLNETVSTALAIYGFSAVIAVLVSFTFAGDIVGFFDKTPPDLITDFKHVIWILGVTTGVGFIMSLLGAIVGAHEHYVAVSLTGVGINLLRAGLTVLFLMKGLGLVGVAWANLIPTVVGIPINYVICRCLAPAAKITVRYARWDVLRTLTVYGATAVVIVLADMLRTQIDSTVIGKLLGFEEVAIYSIAGSLLSQIVSFTIAGLGVLTPRFAHLDGKGHMEELQRLFVKSLHYSALLGFGLCTLAFIWGGNFIRLWVGPTFNRSIPVLWILALAWITDLAQCPAVGMMYALNKHRFYAGACMLEGVLKLGLTLILVKHYGIIGAAVASAVAMVTLRVLVQPIYVAPIVGLSLREYLEPFLLPMASGALVVGACYIAGAFSNSLAGGWFALAACGAVTGVAFVTISAGMSRLLGRSGVPRNKWVGFVAKWREGRY